MDYELFPGHLLVKAIRSSGYKTTINSISELVDNSIQADATNIQIICVDKDVTVGGRRSKKINQIAVYDNGIGMNKEQLRSALQFGNGSRLESENQNGIGKFGMGLPNSSLSRARRVEVWSWQDGETYKAYLDLDIIQSGETIVPEPVLEDIPKTWSKHLLNSEEHNSGTLVIWSELDLVQEKRSAPLLNNSEFNIGRKYRYQIKDGGLKIFLRAYEPDGIYWKSTVDKKVKPNDPLYLMSGTSMPKMSGRFKDTPMFEEFGTPGIVNVQTIDGRQHVITIKFSIVRPEIRKELSSSGNPGATPQGRHASKNKGVSVIRAGRELEPEGSFEIDYNPTERWWGIEVSFPPALDVIMGVDHTKQHAANFKYLNIEEEAKSEKMTVQEFKEMLENDEDPRQVIFEISKRIQANLSPMRKQIARQREGARQQRNIDEGINDPAVEAGSKAIKKRQEEGYSGLSDIEESSSTIEERKETLSELLQSKSDDPDSAREMAGLLVDSNLKYHFSSLPYDGPSFFAIETRGGVMNINVNANHSLHKHLYDILDSDNSEANHSTLIALKIMIQAWARMEDESSDIQRERFSDIRNDWGRMTRDQLRIAFDD
ncbi:MAG: ATP-binding protein [Gammaproteobacteria bacterium]|jgi:hypothetical protein